jgi:uncharacterized iron-regulated membrane protein
MVFAFKWFKTTVYVAATLSTTPPARNDFYSDSTLVRNPGDPLNVALLAGRQQYPDAKRYGVNVPGIASDPIRVTAYQGKEVYYNANTVYCDRFSGKLLGTETYEEQNRGEKLISMNYDIHVGSIAGLPGKIIALFVSLICASLPVTGFLVWWGRRNKKRYAKSSRSLQATHKETLCKTEFGFRP